VTVDVVVQHVQTSWTKLSRGEPGATRRNAVPRGFALPEVTGSFTHQVAVREWEDFTPEFSVRTQLPAGLDVRVEPGRLRVLVDPPFPGATARRPAVRLGPGEWLRWRINGRVSGEDQWIYWLQTYNVAYGRVAPNTFLGEPTHTVEQLASVV
jgi:hypothetical protein